MLSTEIERGSDLYNEQVELLRKLAMTPATARFPGPQPTALTRLGVLEVERGNREYLLCEKTDGVRRLLYFTRIADQPALLALDQRLELERITFADPNVTFDARLFEGTILDCERAPLLTAPQTETFVVFDAYALRGKPFPYNDLRLRLEVAKEATSLCPRAWFEMKRFFSLEHVRILVEQHLPRPGRRHACDGVIFNPVPDPRYCGTHPLMFKWKPLELLTCDFLVRRVLAPRAWYTAYAAPAPDANLELWVVDDGGKTALFAAVACADARLQDGELWEFAHAGGVWVPFRLRKDKQRPNYKSVVLSTLRCMRENIRLEEFFGDEDRNTLPVQS
jgi:hypothetical protein